MSPRDEARAAKVPPVAFGAFASSQERRHWLAPLLTSSGASAGLVALAILLGGVARRVAVDAPIDVTFVEKVAIEPLPPPAPPPPPAPAAVEPLRAAAMAPVVRPEQRLRKLEKPPPPKELVAPKERPQEVPREADPVEDKGVASYGEPGPGDPAGLEGGVTRGGKLGGMVGGVIDLPDGATPPIGLPGNRSPKYPRGASRRDRTGSVLIRLSILADGSVQAAEGVEGDEPFLSAALKAARKWRFRPARLDGQPISVHHFIRVTFEIEG